MATNKRFGMMDCLSWGKSPDDSRGRGDVRDVRNLLAIRDALRANEPAPFDAACWMADAIDKIIIDGGSLDHRLGLKRRGKPSIHRTAEITKRNALLRTLASRIPDRRTNKRADAVIAMLAGRASPPDNAAADALNKLFTLKNLPLSSRQIARIIAAPGA